MGARPPSATRFSSTAKLFYAHAGLFSFSEIIFVLSLPVLLWEEGYSLSFIFLFYALAALPGYFFTMDVIRWMVRTSIKSVFFIGILLYIALGFAIPLIHADNAWWIAALVLLGTQSLFYWPARHLYFAEIAHKNKIGLQSGVLNAVVMIARTIAPILGGTFALFFNFTDVFYFGAIVMLFSLIPLLFIQLKIKPHFDMNAFKHTRRTHPVFTQTRRTYIAEGMNGMLNYLLWPLLFFLFISASDYFELSSLMTITYAISAVIMVIVGHLFDKAHRKRLLKFCIGLSPLTTLGRFSLLFFQPLWFIYLVQSIYSFAESSLQSTFEAYWYSYSKKTNTIFFTIHREINYNLGRFFMGIFLAAIALFWDEPAQLWPFFLLSIPLVFTYWRKQRVDHYLKS